ncbi:MAG TPA: hypothetical protein VKR55_05030 [Bradyrhizobium sp.]|uniref:hypothetical protein n=1 Tax=Bradyrhizobium sp. TaxID=376 RepID=UPI002BE3031A|nr:hypothetical protein [Bradyrhizobium sp.]HLZ01500.1 hypothetical protein [Bradyrhizobium sp.]
MTKRLLLLAAGAMIAASFAGSANAQAPRQRGQRIYSNGPNVVYQQGRTRIYVSKRSWLDGGTEVLPGDRKFTDYAFPDPLGPSFATRNNNRPLEREPLSTPSDLGGSPTRFPLY